jgi:zinc D-Ala-D-Ala dipeptidase
VAVTLARARLGGTCPDRVRGHCLLPMGTGFDDFTPRAWAFATKGVSAIARHDRSVLRRAMAAGGITVYSGEWWHFDGPGSKVHRPHLNAPVY